MLRSDTGTNSSPDSGSETDSGHTTSPDTGVDGGSPVEDAGQPDTGKSVEDASSDAGVDAGHHHDQPDASSCQDQFNCCVQTCGGEHCTNHQCLDKCQEELVQCLGQEGCQH